MAAGFVSLTELQYKLIRDPQTYRPDFERCFENYISMEQLFSCSPSQFISKLGEMLMFLSQVIHFYPDKAQQFSTSVIQILLSRAFGMHPDMRLAFLRAFMKLKIKNLISLAQAVDVSFKLYRCRDKQVRRMLRKFLINDIKRMNKKQRSSRLNTLVQSYLSKVVRDNNSTVAREAVLILIFLFKKNVWNDGRTANLIAEACFAKRKKVYLPAVQFFLGKTCSHDNENSDSESGSDINEETKIKQLRLGHRVGQKTKGRQKRLERSIKNVHKEKARQLSKSNQSTNFQALNLLNDAQTFAERLFRKLERCTDRFEIRLLILDLISRLIGLHKLLILNFYPFIQRFLRPQQKEVTHLLLFSAQASHDQVPPDVMEALTRTIADNFITERASSEAITVGLNSVREICNRCPYAVTGDLLSDLVQYRTYRNKNVVSAARSIIRLYRQFNPVLLPRKERGRPIDSQCEPINNINTGISLTYGQNDAVSIIPGSEVILMGDALRSGKVKKNRIRDKESSELEPYCEDVVKEVLTSVDCNSSDDDDDGGWIDLSHSSDNDVANEVNDNHASQPFLSSENLKDKIMELATSRVFTQKEFEAMRKFQQIKQKRFASAKNKQNILNDESSLAVDSDEDDVTNESASNPNLVSMSAITRLTKRPKQSKAERMEAIEEGRQGREKYGFKINRMNAHASTTNREKLKNKTFQMIKHKVKRKAKRSFHEKQIALREHLKTLAKQSR